MIPNPGFEEHSKIPVEPGEWDKATGWDNVNGISPFAWPYGSPDYLRTDASGDVALPKSVFGYVFPHSGSAVMGLVSIEGNTEEYREYLSARLIHPMVVGNSYDVKFYLSNSQNGSGGSSRCGSDGIGVVFSSRHLVQREHEPIQSKPIWQSDTIIYSRHWIMISFSFVADSAYEYFTIGNFKDDAHTKVSKPKLTELSDDDVNSSDPDTTIGDFSPEYSLVDNGSAYFFLDDILVKLSQSADISPLPAQGPLFGLQPSQIRYPINHYYCLMAQYFAE